MKSCIRFAFLCVLVLIIANQTYAQGDDDRFQKIVLADDLNEPMELAVLPDGRVMFIERVGAIKLYDPQSEAVQLIRTMNVHSGHEDGLLGLALDPNFAQNSLVYLFYSPDGDEPLQRVSRFLFDGNTLLLDTEQILIEIPTQRVECCHSAGSLAFGPEGNLFIATGDNTNPHNPGYYNSVDEREGRAYWDAQRTSGNSQDLRGKILRIKPMPAGGYEIPDGNLFPKDGSIGRPEIYVMGCRNPYRISVDQKNGNIFWGDVGQNTIDNPARGPISYDEWNMATGPGFFGWPYFAGDNQAYAEFDFETEEIGPFHDSNHPINDSPNNTGTQALPPAQPALIWYSYQESEIFDHLGTGGKSPVGGPVYYADLYPKQFDTSNLAPWLADRLGDDAALNFPKRKFPGRFDGKLFIAEWMRDWVNVVSINDAGRVAQIERFMPSETFSHPIELEFGPDGALYMLEYGLNWFAPHQDARLTRIDYVYGNRPPRARIAADIEVGAAPLTVHFSADQSYDLDADALTYAWQFGDEGQSDLANPFFVFERAGVYDVILRVTDSNGATSTTNKTIRVGNDMPKISLELAGNQSFFWQGEPLSYEVEVQDREDGGLKSGDIPEESVVLTIGVADMGSDITIAAQDHAGAVGAYLPEGLTLINNSDCRACHAPDQISVGPSYQEISDRYRGDTQAISVLVDKVIRGSSGTWGNRIMSAHPQLSQEDVTKMVQYILGFGDEAPENRVSTKGTYMPESGDDLLFSVSYRDEGGEVIESLTARSQFVIRNAQMPAVRCDDYHQATKFNSEEVRFTASGGYIAFRNIDLENIDALTVLMSIYKVNASLEVRTGSPDGAVIGKLEIEPTYTENRAVGATVGDANRTEFTIPLGATSGRHDVYVIFNVASGEQYTSGTSMMEWVRFEKGS